MNTIYIDYGVYTALTVDLSEFDFTGIQEIVLTACNSDNCIIFKRVYTEPKLYDEIITPEESEKVKFNAHYDFKKTMADGKTYSMNDTGYVVLRRGCVDCQTQ